MVSYKGENRRRLIWCVLGSSFELSSCTHGSQNFCSKTIFKFECCNLFLKIVKICQETVKDLRKY